MSTFRFEIQAYKKVDVRGFKDAHSAREYIVDHLEEYMRDMCGDAYLSNGEKVDVAKGAKS